MRNVFHSMCFLSMLVGIILLCTKSCADRIVPTPVQYKYIEIKDTTLINNLKDSIKSLNDTIAYFKNDTNITAELFVLRYKIERIRYYNECAGKGNNLKFLRGWINRVINE